MESYRDLSLGASLGQFFNSFFEFLCTLIAIFIVRFGLGIEAFSIMTFIEVATIWLHS